MSIFRQRKIKKAAICCLFNNYALFFALAEHAVFGFDRLAERGGKAAQSFLLRRGEVFRDRDSHGHELVASAAGAQERNALALEAEGRAGLRALGYVELYLTVERGNLDLRAERRSRKGYVLIKEHRRALALKPCVGLHEHRYQQIAGRAAVYAGVALSAQRYGLSVVDAGRDADAHLVLAADAADAVAGENFLVLLGDYVVPNRDICDKMLAVSKEHGGASVIAVAACAPEEVSRYGVIAGDRVGSLEGFENAADDEPGAVWRIGGLVEKPAPEAAPSNLYIVGRYLLSPLVMDLLADQQAGKGGEIQLTDAMARSLDRETMYAVVIDPLSGYDTGTPSGWMATNALMAASDPRFASAFWDAIDERGGLMRK